MAEELQDKVQPCVSVELVKGRQGAIEPALLWKSVQTVNGILISLSLSI